MNIKYCFELCFFFLRQGNRYWRFNNDILDEDYPREISVGFEGIPDDIDATFAVPAPGHLGREKAYFFKGIFVWMYDIILISPSLKALCADMQHLCAYWKQCFIFFSQLPVN